MAPARAFLSSHIDSLLFHLSRAGFDLFEQQLVRRPRGVKLDGPAQFFDRLGVGVLILRRPARAKMNPALLVEHLAGPEAQGVGIAAPWTVASWVRTKFDPRS